MCQRKDSVYILDKGCWIWSYQAGKEYITQVESVCNE